jgi:hypothetical protein
MLGDNWPNNGEIDIIEGMNEQSQNQMTLHTTDNCTIQSTGFTGTVDTDNCSIEARGQPANSGCTIQNDNTESYGTGFNDAGGGVYATEWTGSAINVWFFPSYRVPRDVYSDTPRPETWGMPAARFAGDCDIDKHFNDLRIVFDVTFCGDWAGSVWGSSECAGRAGSGSCVDYVRDNPRAFEETYWYVRSLKVYQDRGEMSADEDEDKDEGEKEKGDKGEKKKGDEKEKGDEKRALPLVPRASMKHRREHYRHGRGHGRGHGHA